MKLNNLPKKVLNMKNAISGEFYQGEQKLIQKKYKIGRLKKRVTDKF